MIRLLEYLRRQWTLALLIVVALLLAWATWSQGGLDAVVSGLGRGAATLWSVTLLLVAAFLTAGLTQALISREIIDRWLGARSGWRGILLVCLAGVLMPGGPYVYYPIAGALLQAGAGLGVLMAFLIAKNLWSITRIPMELALLGPRLTIIRYLLTFLVPPILGFLAEALFGRHLSKLREAVE